jgi:hypothetical protein
MGITVAYVKRKKMKELGIKKDNRLFYYYFLIVFCLFMSYRCYNLKVIYYR